MKRIALTLMIVMTAMIGFGQNSKRTSAYNYHRFGQLDKAKEAIDEAAKNEKTIGDAKTWFYRGNIYLDIANSKDEKYKDLDSNALQVALNSYEKATQLDEKGDFKSEILPRMMALAESFYNEGVTSYNKSKFKSAALDFEKAYDINASVGKNDTTALYNAAVAANIGKEDTLAQRLYNKVLAMNYQKADIYNSLSEIYKKEGDTTKALTTIEKGRQLFPDDFNLLISETNIYLSTNEKEKAMKNLEQASEQDKTNPTIFFAVGTIYDQMGDTIKAINAYKKAIDLKPDYFEANYNLGALYVNTAADLISKANDLPLNATKEYNILKKKADENLANSLPYLEKAQELHPEDTNTLVSLKEIYTRLGMLDKLKAVNEKLGSK